MSAIAWAPIAGVATCAAVGMVRRYALRHDVLDRPNERSSHRVPTPRGGGLGLVAVLLLLVPIAIRPWSIGMIALEIAVAAVALVGWLDDRAALRVRSRIAVHLAAACTVARVAVWLAAPAPIALPVWAAAIWWAFWTVSAINVVNFMDGIDGLIGSQLLIYAIYVTIAASSGSAAQLLASMCAGGCVGFLVFNWSPARIFLGDVGSGSLGLVAIMMGMLLLVDGDDSFVRAFLPLLPLFSDATVTLLRRAARGERVWTAHREHLYQRLANGRWTHARTALVYGAATIGGAVVASLDGVRIFAVSAITYVVAIAITGAWLEARVQRWSRGTSASPSPRATR